MVDYIHEQTPDTDPFHVITRYFGDVENPKGGVRGVIADKKLYELKPD